MRLSNLLWPALASAAAACAPPQGDVPERFAVSGELIAMSGGEAGAENACFTCHGLGGGGNGAGVPRLAGLNAGYIQHQMVAFADARRENRSMRWIAKKMTPREILLVSAYYSALEWDPPRPTRAPPPPEIYLVGDASRNIAPCAACHGVDGLGIGQAIPPLAGQPRQYLSQQLHQWRHGQRRSDPGNVMLEIARSLTPEEIEAVSAFASQLPSVSARPEFREAYPSGRRYGPRNDASLLPRRVAGS